MYHGVAKRTVSFCRRTAQKNYGMTKKKKKGVAWAILIVSICVMAIAGYNLWETWQVYRIGNDNYEHLTDLVRPDGSFSSENVKPPNDMVLNVEVPHMIIDFRALQEINADAVAWLYQPNTAIDYPVMRSNNYSYYLDHLPDGTYNANGSLFIDYNCAPDFTDSLTIVYGHNMKSGRMFGSLEGYKKQAYFNELQYMYLYTAQGNYRIDLVYGCVIGAGQWRERAFMFKENLDALLAYAAHSTTFASRVEYADDDRIVVLSTCSYDFDNARYVVIGVLRPEYLPL